MEWPIYNIIYNIFITVYNNNKNYLKFTGICKKKKKKKSENVPQTAEPYFFMLRQADPRFLRPVISSALDRHSPASFFDNSSSVSLRSSDIRLSPFLSVELAPHFPRTDELTTEEDENKAKEKDTERSQSSSRFSTNHCEPERVTKWLFFGRSCRSRLANL